MASLQLRLFLDGGERALSLDEPVISVGRDDDQRLRLADPSVSRRHGRFEQGADGWRYVDLGSSNRSRLNGAFLTANEPVRIRPGDRLQFGAVQAMLLDTPQATPSEGPAASHAAPWPLAERLAADRAAASRGRARIFPPASASTPDATERQAAGAGVRRVADPTPPAPRPAQVRPLADRMQQARSEARAGGGAGRSEARILRVGRAIDNDLVIDDPFVSSYHLEAWFSGGDLLVRDLGSSNGTFLDDRPISDAAVPHDGALRLGRTATVPAASLIQALASAPRLSQYSREMRQPGPNPEHLLVGERLGRVVDGGKKVLLRDVDISVRRGQFVAIAGASGAGKSTLMKILNGYTAPNSGRLLSAGGSDPAGAIGYVPQEDIIHRELPLRDALTLSARLRYPPQTATAVMQARADEVLAQLGLSEHAGTQVAQLSGGQRKRASVALELMTRPRLLLLDEPTSGLDPASDRRLIALLSSLSDAGIGIVLITHAVGNIAACDTLAVLAPGGYLVYWGEPEAAKRYFGVTDYEAIYERLDSDATPADWRARFESSPEWRELQDEIGAGRRDLASYVAPAVTPPTAGLVRWQLKGLAERYTRIMLGDRRNLLLLLAQAPVIVLLARLLFTDHDVLVRQSRDGGLNLLFILAASCVWLGTINAAREICKEGPIWERERHVGVLPLPYVFSKVLVLGGLSLIQSVTLAGLTALLWSLPSGGVALGLTVAALLTALSGVALGLTISALVPTPDRAVALAPLAMIPQIMFGGALIPLADMGGGGNALSALVGSRWGYSAIGRLTDRASYVPALTGVGRGAPNPVLEQVDGPWIVPLIALLLLASSFLALTVWLVSRRGRGAR